MPAQTIPAPRQLGRTLIELLVAIALGLLILLGVGSLYLGSAQSTRVAVNVASVEESGQIALTLLGDAIRRAGYAEIVGADSNTNVRAHLLYNGPNVRGCTAANFVDANAGNFACGTAGTGPDTLAVWYQSDNVVASAQGATTDCIGNNAPTGAFANPSYVGRVPTMGLVRNVYFVNNGSLFCLGNGSNTPQALLTGVEDFKVYFGFDDDAYANPATWVDRPAARSIRTAADLINNFPDPSADISRWSFVVSVHLCVLVRTQEAGVSAQGGNVTFAQCPQTADQMRGVAAAPTTTLSDGVVRRAYTQVFAIRSNVSPVPLPRAPVP